MLEDFFYILLSILSGIVKLNVFIIKAEVDNRGQLFVIIVFPITAHQTTWCVIFKK